MKFFFKKEDLDLLNSLQKIKLDLKSIKDLPFNKLYYIEHKKNPRLFYFFIPVDYKDDLLRVSESLNYIGIGNLHQTPASFLIEQDLLSYVFYKVLLNDNEE